MCTTCGCSDEQTVTINGRQTGRTVHDHDHKHDHHHSHDQPHTHVSENHQHGPVGEIIQLEQDLLAKNDHIALHNREWFQDQGILALNILGSPGAGKTTLLETTLGQLARQIPCAVVEGDQATQHDAERIRATGAAAVQVNTGPGCHLEADMLAKGLHELQPERDSILFIENVGNLVCPALFDLGEAKRVVLLSVTEGEDKPIKYPHMFRGADLLLLHKSDLLPHLNFDVQRCLDYARDANPNIEVITLSSTSGEGTEDWYDWLITQRASIPAEINSAQTGAVK